MIECGSIPRVLREGCVTNHKTRDLLNFINDRCTQPEFLARMHAVVQDQPDVAGCIREEIETFGASVWPFASSTTLIISFHRRTCF